MTELSLPKGEDLSLTLQFAFPTHAYALYGLEVDQIIVIANSDGMEAPDQNTLVWFDSADPPSKETIAAAWVNLQREREKPPLNIDGFLSGVYEDPELRGAVATANPIMFTMLLRLLDAKAPSFPSIQGAMDQLRATMPADFTSIQRQKLADLAAVSGLPLTFN